VTLYEETVQQGPHTGGLQAACTVLGHGCPHRLQRLLEPVHPALGRLAVVKTCAILEFLKKVDSVVVHVVEAALGATEGRSLRRE